MKGSKKKKPLTRSEVMSRIRSKNTGIEVLLRKALWREGIRYRKNYAGLPGAPDIAITKYRIAVFCDGEFWHGRNWQKERQKFRTNADYWRAKIEGNIGRDTAVDDRLFKMGWIVLRFWGKEIQNDLEKCVWEVRETIITAQEFSE